jgi:hypothetical protein
MTANVAVAILNGPGATTLLATISIHLAVFPPGFESVRSFNSD